jgi:hypothetical protein
LRKLTEILGFATEDRMAGTKQVDLPFRITQGKFGRGLPMDVGLNIAGQCQHEDCPSNGAWFSEMRGYGCYRAGEVVRCPTCGMPANVSAHAFQKCEYTVEWPLGEQVGRIRKQADDPFDWVEAQVPEGESMGQKETPSSGGPRVPAFALDALAMRPHWK